MERLFRFLASFIDYFVLLLLLIISISLIYFTSTNEVGGFRSLVVVSLGQFKNIFSSIPNPIQIASENRTLTDLNIVLSNEVTVMRQALNQNNELRHMLDLYIKQPNLLIACDVIKKSTSAQVNIVTLNKGSLAGIKRGMCAISVAGLAGIVIGVNDNYSIVELLNNRNTNIPGYLTESAFDGIVTWNNDEFLYINNVPKTEPVKVGELVTTSLFSKLFPPGIPIGVIEKVDEISETHFHRITLKPSTSFFRFSQLFVVDYIQDPEEIELIEEVENRLLKISEK